ncbi:hypothetical protein [Haematobacter missouriensis]|uniref:hypothetical protein n=1 Tax=Haematobacter missouriensis TaxID=366616 RepID=UPI00117AA898|nr:hypothetical protein [Haematobacter missouriensis]
MDWIERPRLIVALYRQPLAISQQLDLCAVQQQPQGATPRAMRDQSHDGFLTADQAAKLGERPLKVNLLVSGSHRGRSPQGQTR